MIKNNFFKINIEVIINRILCEKKIIDEETFMNVQDYLLKKINDVSEKRYL